MFAALAAPLPCADALFAQEARYADLLAIDLAVARFVGAPTGAPGGAQPVDRRLRLARCHAPLALAWHADRRDAVRVSCPDANGWRVFVAVPSATPDHAEARPAIARGEPVTIRITGRAFAVTAAGQAMDSGAAGAFIRVRPGDGGKPLRARVEQPGLVTVMLGPEA